MDTGAEIPDRSPMISKEMRARLDAEVPPKLLKDYPSTRKLSIPVMAKRWVTSRPLPASPLEGEQPAKARAARDKYEEWNFDELECRLPQHSEAHQCIDCCIVKAAKRAHAVLVQSAGQALWLRALLNLHRNVAGDVLPEVEKVIPGLQQAGRELQLPLGNYIQVLAHALDPELLTGLLDGRNKKLVEPLFIKDLLTQEVPLEFVAAVCGALRTPNKYVDLEHPKFEERCLGVKRRLRYSSEKKRGLTKSASKAKAAGKPPRTPPAAAPADST